MLAAILFRASTMQKNAGNCECGTIASLRPQRDRTHFSGTPLHEPGDVPPAFKNHRELAAHLCE
jgi:hypothetical protein